MRWIRLIREWINLFAIAAVLTVFMIWVVGCAAPGARQGTVELAPEIVTKADVEATVKAVGLELVEEINKTSRTTQKAVAAISIVDQSTSDKWMNRAAVAGMVAVAVLVVVFASYPVGKRRWLRQDKQCTSGPSGS